MLDTSLAGSSLAATTMIQSFVMKDKWSRVRCGIRFPLHAASSLVNPTKQQVWCYYCPSRPPRDDSAAGILEPFTGSTGSIKLHYQICYDILARITSVGDRIRFCRKSAGSSSMLIIVWRSELFWLLCTRNWTFVSIYATVLVCSICTASFSIIIL